ncbi:MAG TPA: CehA/McbA family metallohydrolase [Kofleriaceae bacterium]
MSQLRFIVVTVGFAAACNGGSGLDDYFPSLPDPTGDPQQAFAGEVTDEGQLVGGPARSGLVGDFYIKNDRVSFIVQAPTRVIGVIPQGGNVVDAVLTDGTQQTVDDHFGELGLIYLLGRTCEPDRIEVVRDGSKGGVAVLRSIGESGNDDFLNVKGIGVLPVDITIDPDIDDNVECATTYILEPGSTTLEVYHSLYNAGPDRVAGPMGTVADTGGNTEAWTNTRGFERADIGAITTLGSPQPSDYVVYQGPGVAYGVIPRHDKPTPHTQTVIAGVSILLDGNSNLLEILQRDKPRFLDLAAGKGLMQRYDLVVAKDANAVDAVWRKDETLTPIAGKVEWAGGGTPAGARVGVFTDGNGNGVLDPVTVDDNSDGTVDDHAISYMDVQADGTFSGVVPAGNLFMFAEVKNAGRSTPVALADNLTLTIPSPVKIDFQIIDADTSTPIPGTLLVLGDHPAFPDKRLFEVYDRTAGVVTQRFAIRGTTTDLGDGADDAIYVPANGNYRVYASRGTEWSVASAPVTGAADVDLTFTLKHVVPTPGYLSTDWHVHQIGSPDSPVLETDRVRSAVAAGVEMFAATDHDYVTDMQPVVEQLGLTRHVRVVPGIEVTPFAYGHFNAWPMELDRSSPNRGAVDWARGAALGYAMMPGEIYDAMRARGAQMVQVNHPRGSGFTEFQAAFTRANVKYDYTNRVIFGDYENANTPNDWLRLPGESLWSDKFNGLEVWNGFTIADSNGDMLRENKSLDRVMRDWLSMLSLGFYVTPAGNSDTHTLSSDPAGMPRTYVRVADDSPTALMSPASVDAVIAAQTGANNTARDVVITDGPMIDVRVNNMPALGRVVAATNQSVTIAVTITSADWAKFDTLEVFANTTPEPPTEDTTLAPLKCWTSRPLASLAAKDPCATAALSAESMTVTLATLPGGGGFRRYEATVQVTLDAQDISTRAGATGTDAWLVFRARGDRGIFPILLKGDTVSETTMPVLLTGDMTAIGAALDGRGVPATAFTAPVFVDFDGGGYRAPFAP